MKKHILKNLKKKFFQALRRYQILECTFGKNTKNITKKKVKTFCQLFRF